MPAKAKLLLAAAVVGVLLLVIGIATLRGPRASDSRQIDVRDVLAKQKPVATHASSVPIKFANGATLTLVGITDAPGSSARWWAPDGTRIDAPANVPPSRLSAKPPDGLRVYQLLFVESGLSAEDAEELTIAAPKSHSETTGRPARSNGYFSHAASLPSDLQSANLVVMNPHGPWHTAWRYDVPQSGAATKSATTTAATTRPGMIVESIREEGKETIVQMRRVEPAREHVWESLRMVLVSGKKVGVSGIGFKENGAVQILSINDAPKSQIVAVECQQQNIESFELRDVSLKSGNKTSATVTQPTTQP